MAESEMIEFEVWQHNCPVATTSAVIRDQALREALHYASVYSQDGPVEVYEVKRLRLDLATLSHKD